MITELRIVFAIEYFCKGESGRHFARIFCSMEEDRRRHFFFDEELKEYTEIEVLVFEIMEGLEHCEVFFFKKGGLNAVAIGRIGGILDSDSRYHAWRHG